jgi:hypothetical protein
MINKDISNTKKCDGEESNNIYITKIYLCYKILCCRLTYEDEMFMK